MKIIGITGSLAAGKTTASGILSSVGIPVWEADKVVHQLIRGKAKKAIIQRFGGKIKNLAPNGIIDRKVLGNYVFPNANNLKSMEAILHPMVAMNRQQFLQRHRTHPLVVLDVPLLFERNIHNNCHITILITAPKWLRKHRARRRGLSKLIIQQITSRQMPQREKMQLANVVVANFLGRYYLKWRLKLIIKQLVASHSMDKITL